MPQHGKYNGLNKCATIHFIVLHPVPLPTHPSSFLPWQCSDAVMDKVESDARILFWCQFTSLHSILYSDYLPIIHNIDYRVLVIIMFLLS
jgi:hypothetical protein